MDQSDKATTYRHVALSVNAPPINGPATLAIPYIAPTNPMNAGRRFRGTVCATIRMAPEKTPAAPTPATALPMIRALELGATPQTRDPSSNIARPQR